MTKTKRRAITPKERDAIVEAIRDHPQDLEAVAQRFGRSLTTIVKLQARARIRSRATRDLIAAAAIARRIRVEDPPV